MDTTGGYQSLLGLTSINSNSSTIDVLDVENININGVIDLSQAIVGGLTTSQVDEGLNLYYTDTRVNNNSNVSSNTTHRDRKDNPHAVTATQVGINSTDDIIEGVTNLYYTDIRFDDRLATKTTTSLAEGSNLYYTDARFDTRFGIKTTTDLTEGTNLYYTDARFDTRFGIKTTTDLTEGTNLYYTTTRANADFDTRLAIKTTTNLSEGTNLYYTDARFDNRLATKTTTDLAEGTNLYYTDARFDSRFGIKTTTDLTEGTNLYYTTSRANTDFDTRFGIKTTTDLAEGTNLYYTEARVSANTDVKANSDYRSVGHLPLAGGTLTGDLDMNYNTIEGVNLIEITADETTPVWTSDTTNEGIGWYLATSNNDRLPVYRAFNNTYGPSADKDDAWFPLDSTGNYNIDGTVNTASIPTTALADASVLYGEWIQIANTNRSMQMVSFILVTRNFSWYSYPTDFTIIGSQDGTSWYVVYETTGLTFSGQGESKTINTPANGYYKYFRFIVQRVFNITGDATGGYPRIGEWRPSFVYRGNLDSTLIEDVKTNSTKVSADGSIDTHSDVSILDVQDQQFLKYSSFTQKWANVTPTTAMIAEHDNLYYTDARFDTRLATKTTTDITEGTNLYYTEARFDTSFGVKKTTDLTEGINLYYTDTRFDTRLATKTTTNLTEGTNLYYTEARVSANTDVKANSDYRAVGHLPLSGGTLTGNLNMGNYKITSVATPTADTDGANKKYIDDKFELYEEGKVLAERYSIATYANNTAEMDARFNGLTPNASQYLTNLYTVGWSGEQFGVIYNCYLYVPTDGNITFRVRSDDSSDWFIDDALVASNYGGHGVGGGVVATSTVFMTAGFHKSFSRFIEQTGGEGMIHDWDLNGGSTFTTIPTANIFIPGVNNLFDTTNITSGTIITTSERANIATNTAKVSYPSADSTKVGFISVTQAVNLDTMESDIATNNNKVSYPSADSTKVGFISVTQAVNLDTMESDIATNNNKISYPSADSTKVGFISVTQAVNLDTMESDIATNNNKISYPSADSTKVGFISVTQAVNLDTMESDIATNNNKISYPSADSTKVGFISVTQAVNLDTMESDIANKVSADGSINTHSDVNITAPADGHVLTYDTGEWKNLAPAEVTGYLPLDGSTAMTGALNIDPSNHGEKVIFYETTPTEVPYGIQTSNGYIMHGVEYNGSHVFIYDIDGKLATAGYTLQLNRLGSIMNTELSMNNHKITDLTTPTDTADATTKGYVDTAVNAKLSVNGTSIMIGNLNMGNYDIDNVNQVFINRSGLANNKLVLYDAGNGSTTDFYGFGIQSATLMYNINSTGANHKFYYAGVYELFRIGHSGIYSYRNLDVTGNITVSGTVDGIDIQSLNTTVGGKLSLTGGTMSGNLDMGGYNINTVGTVDGYNLDTLNTNINSKLPLSGGTVTGNLTISGFFTANGGSKLVVQNGIEGIGRGIYMWASNNLSWGIYMATYGGGKSFSGGTANKRGNVTSHAIRFRVHAGTSNGFIWENSNNDIIASLDFYGNFVSNGPYSINSDRRKKENFGETFGLEFINKLKPVSYNMINDKKVRHGLIAQEVEEVLAGYDLKFSGLQAVKVKIPNPDCKYKDDPSQCTMLDTGEVEYSLSYSEFIAPLIKAVQELSAEVKKLKNRIEILESPII